MKRYGDRTAVSDVGFFIRRGEIFGLLGTNGAGKTSTLECLSGLRQADSGNIMIGGHDARRPSKELKDMVGVMLQTTDLQERITPREALILFGSFYSNALSPDSLMHRFGLTEKADSAFGTLSGGLRQRLALALAFVNNPSFILLDEPTAGLDPLSRRALHTEIVRLRQEGRTVLLSTHNLEEAERLCDRIAIIDRGRLIATGAPSELVARSAMHANLKVVTSPPLSFEQIANLPFVKRVDGPNNQVDFHTNNPTATLAGIPRLLLENNATLVELKIMPATLEEYFLRLVSKDYTSSST